MRRATWCPVLILGACLVAGCGRTAARDEDAAFAGGEPGAAAKDWTAALQPLRLYLPLNFLTGSPWMIDVFSARDVKEELEREYVFHAEGERALHSYNLRTFCYEIVRATGKRLVWIDDLEVDCPKEYGDWGVYDSPLERGPVWKTEYGRMCRRSLGSVLQCLVTHLPNLGPPEDKERNSVWTAWVGRDRIYLVRLPRAQPSEVPAETPPTNAATVRTTYKTASAAEPPESDEPVLYVLDTEIVLPHGKEGAAIPKAALPSLAAQETLLGRQCRVGGVDVGGYEKWASWLARGTGMTVTWHPAPTNARHRNDYETPVGTSEEEAADDGVPPRTASAAEVLWCVLGDATECGVAREEPDREIWVGLITEKGFVFLLLPSPYW